jgi:hypothetical protein
MANYELVFFGTEESGTNDTTLKCYLNSLNKISIEVENDYATPFGSAFIVLDKSTAIKLAKKLRTEINKMEVDNV